MKLKTLIITAFAAASAIITNAQDCDIRVGIAPIEQGEKVPSSIGSRLENFLTQTVCQYGVTADPYYSQFFITGRFDNDVDDIIPGIPTKYVIQTTLTLMIGDAVNEQVYATTTVDLTGVGDSKKSAYINALGSLPSKRSSLASFIETAKTKIIGYYDKNYKSYLAKARTAMKLRNYDEALFYTSSVPTCSSGYGEASNLTAEIFQSNVDYDADMLLAQARAIWAANPTREGAIEACSLLAMIDPSAKCYPAAKMLGEQIGSVIKEDQDFWTKGVYKDTVELKKMRINAARDIGVAWAKNQPKIVTNFVSRNRYYHVF